MEKYRLRLSGGSIPILRTLSSLSFLWTMVDVADLGYLQPRW